MMNVSLPRRKPRTELQGVAGRSAGSRVVEDAPRIIEPRGFAPRTPLHASAFAKATARPRRSSKSGGGHSRGPRPHSVRVAHSLRSFAVHTFEFDREIFQLFRRVRREVGTRRSVPAVI